NLPGHEGCETLARRRLSNPVLERERLPRLVPCEFSSWNCRGRGADVRREREQPVEASKGFDIPWLGLRDGQLCEDQIRVDEDLARDSRVLLAPEAGASRKVDEQLGIRAVLADIRRAAAVIAPVVVDERPAVAKTEGFQRSLDIRGAVARIRRPRILNR